MGEIVKTKYADFEVYKVQDFAHTADSPVEILNAVLKGAFDDVVKLIHLASAISVPVTAAHATLDRLDTLEETITFLLV